MFEIFIFGISGGRLEREHLKKIEQCSAVAASERHHSLLKRIVDVQRIAISPVEEMIFELALALNRGDVAVLASGDPLFFGIGRTLLERFGHERVHVFPALSAVQLACTRFKISWDNLPLISLHGRSSAALPGRILSRPRVMLFTDQRSSPTQIAADLLAVLKRYGDAERSSRITVRVAENLGWSSERLWSGTLEEAAREIFAPLNMMLLEQDPAAEEDDLEAAEAGMFAFGLEEGEISHSRGLITKDEIRAVILHRLRLPARGVLWDVGGGSGSISVEAARLCPELSIYVVEQKEESQSNIRANVVRYGLYNIHLVCGQAPDALSHLPNPDRIFIGGSRGLLAEIIPVCAGRLASGGRMVVSAVLQNTAEQAPLLMAANGLEADARTISVTREAQTYSDDGQLGWRLNPITIITGKK